MILNAMLLVLIFSFAAENAPASSSYDEHEAISLVFSIPEVKKFIHKMSIGKKKDWGNC